MLYEELGKDACKKLLIDRGLNAISAEVLVNKGPIFVRDEYNHLIKVVKSGYGSKDVKLTDESFKGLCKQLIKFIKEEEKNK